MIELNGSLTLKVLYTRLTIDDVQSEKSNAFGLTVTVWGENYGYGKLHLHMLHRPAICNSHNCKFAGGQFSAKTSASGENKQKFVTSKTPWQA